MTNTGKKDITIGIADDQQLFVRSLSALINSISGFQPSLEAFNGEDLIRKLINARVLPDILLIDVNMPPMNGPEAAQAISEKFPHVKMVALSMQDDDTTIIRMLKAGCCAYLQKDISPAEFEKALNEVSTKGFYNGDLVNIKFRRLIMHESKDKANELTAKELSFLKLACSDLTYKQIASEMKLAERTIDGYRESVFEKLNVQSRVGMALEAIRKGLVKL